MGILAQLTLMHGNPRSPDIDVFIKFNEVLGRKNQLQLIAATACKKHFPCEGEVLRPYVILVTTTNAQASSLVSF